MSSSNHPVSDLVARIKNGYLAKKTTISSPASKLRDSILRILKDEGYIASYSKSQEGSATTFNINLKYHYSDPVVSDIHIVSKPGRRVYCRAGEIPSVKNGLGVTVISTSQGVLADHEARNKSLGGEILLKIF